MSFLSTADDRRAVYLNLVSWIESQLRDAYAELNEAGAENQSSIAKKLGVGRSAVNRRLTGQHNMTIETLADLVWALQKAITVNIFDPRASQTSNSHIHARTTEPIDAQVGIVPVERGQKPTSSPDFSRIIVATS